MRAAHRAARRAAAAGFTLIELMVVVLLVATLAVIAIPAMRTARDDRLAFDYARRYAAVLHRAGARAVARGAAHLVIVDTANRGRVRLFEAWGPVPPRPPFAAPSPPYKQATSCKVPNQWNEAAGYSPGAATTYARIVDWVELDASGVNTDMNIATTARFDDVEKPVFVLCYTPGGNVYGGAGSDVGAAIGEMQKALPFTGTAEVRLRRRTSGGAGLGLTRRVIVGGGAAPRLQSM